jgi:hypothetical protein
VQLEHAPFLRCEINPDTIFDLLLFRKLGTAEEVVGKTFADNFVAARNTRAHVSHLSIVAPM